MESVLLVEGTLTESDLLSVARYTVRNRSIVMKIVLALTCFMVLVGISSIAMGKFRNAVMPLLLGTFFFGSFLISTRPSSAKKQVKLSAHVYENGRYEFESDHFSINRPSHNVSMAWSDVHSVVELPDVFAIFTTRMCFVAVPKRFFDAAQLDSFRVLIRSTSGKGGKPLCPSATSIRN